MGMSLLTQSYLFLCFTTGLISAAFFVSWVYDNQRLYEIAHTVSEDGNNNAERIIKLNEWVYSNQGFAKNEKYLILKKLGPTPIDILEHGGDCADKSRLLAAMLKQLGIRSTLAMLYPCRDCQPGHTVVEAEYEDGWMVIDPVYNLWFPIKPNEYYGESYMGLKLLMSNPDFLKARLQYLREHRGTSDKINHYDDNMTIYAHARTINWDKNGLVKFVGDMMSRFGKDPYLMRRPYVMEDPKLAMAIISGVITIGLLILYFTLWRNLLSST